jgi:hypothetical protein
VVSIHLLYLMTSVLTRLRDFQKLIFYYYADHYINFKDLVVELYRIYKTRIWLSAINPASFSQHAMGQPPSGIGPGAMIDPNTAIAQYATAYGPAPPQPADPDPYGAIPPYRIGYNTYNPNYPSIPGVANSFMPGHQVGYGAAAFGNGDPTPSVPPGVVPTGNLADYNYYYDRSANNLANQYPPPQPLSHTNPFYSATTPQNAFYGRITGDAQAGNQRQPAPPTTLPPIPANAFQAPIGTRPEASIAGGASTLFSNDLIPFEQQPIIANALPHFNAAREFVPRANYGRRNYTDTLARQGSDGEEKEQGSIVDRFGNLRM